MIWVSVYWLCVSVEWFCVSVDRVSYSNGGGSVRLRVGFSKVDELVFLRWMGGSVVAGI